MITSKIELKNCFICKKSFDIQEMYIKGYDYSTMLCNGCYREYMKRISVFSKKEGGEE